MKQFIFIQLKTVLPSKEMHWLASELRKLGKVMDECRLVPAPDSSYQKTQAAKLQGREGIRRILHCKRFISAEASNLERQSLLSLRRLIDLSSVSLVSFLLQAFNSTNNELTSYSFKQ